MTTSIDQTIIGNILGGESRVDDYLDGCTIQLRTGDSTQDPSYVAYGHIGQPNGASGLAWKNQPTDLFIRYIDGKLRLSPAINYNTYISSLACCSWNENRWVDYGNHPTHDWTGLKTRYQPNGKGDQYAGQIVIGYHGDDNNNLASKGAVLDTITGRAGDQWHYITVIELGNKLAEKYYPQAIKKTEMLTGRCCAGDFSDPTTEVRCELADYLPGSSSCDVWKTGFCKKHPDNPMCGSLQWVKGFDNIIIISFVFIFIILIAIYSSRRSAAQLPIRMPTKMPITEQYQSAYI
jgi:hypothetical protein